MTNHHHDWVSHPTGAISKGHWCQHCKRYNTRHSTVEVMVLKDNQILLIKRNISPQKNWWAMPGGYVDWDETTQQAVQRELKEEVGLGIKEINLLGVYSDTKRDLDGRQNIGHAYLVVPKGTIKIDKKEVTTTKWFDLDDLPAKIAFDHRTMIEDYKKGTSNRQKIDK